MTPFSRCENPGCDHGASFDWRLWAKSIRASHDPARFTHAGYDDFFGYVVRHDGTPEED